MTFSTRDSAVGPELVGTPLPRVPDIRCGIRHKKTFFRMRHSANVTDAQQRVPTGLESAVGCGHGYKTATNCPRFASAPFRPFDPPPLRCFDTSPIRSGTSVTRCFPENPHAKIAKVAKMEPDRTPPLRTLRPWREVNVTRRFPEVHRRKQRQQRSAAKGEHETTRLRPADYQMPGTGSHQNTHGPSHSPSIF